MWPNFTVNLCISLHLNIYFLYKGKEGMIENLEKYLQYSYLVLSGPLSISPVQILQYR